MKNDRFVAETREWFQYKAGYKSEDDWKAVVGISGGKDSSVVAALLCKAIGKEKVYGILMPNGEQKDIQDSRDLCELLGINWTVVNIGSTYADVINGLNFGAVGARGHISTNFEADTRVTTNLPARLRMCVLYAVANHINARVIGTGNKSERLASYYTLFGDSACDFAPISDLWVDEVIDLGRLIGLPSRFLEKPPSDGMCGQTDEERLGFSYAELKLCVTDPGTAKTVLGHKCDYIANIVRMSHWKSELLSGIPRIKGEPDV